MGNAVASSLGRRRVKIMKLDGEVLKFKPPVTVEQIVQNYPNHVILQSEAVRHMGIRAQPLEELMELRPKQLYYLVEMPKREDLRAPTRVRSVINMSAKSRLEAMLLARRSSSDIGALSSSHCVSSSSLDGVNGGPIRVQVRLTKAQLAELESQSKNSSETAQKILSFYLNDGEARKSVGHSHDFSQASGLRSSLKTLPKTERRSVRFSSNVQSDEDF
ncbi:hypothetical protein SUGI_1074340 [Cryptomeria japonica]|uniref:uncharacterized protein At1g66480 n=1 Tax=Cryptomeria japonica TaxID=3369 RepID=UPI002414C04C|nr:uncharacterized protein At1g66480 [Cryptomeria japonica]GLJ50408.1 hypothetical protein SUGI_1074340 [Cryptomeria japonica]